MAGRTFPVVAAEVAFGFDPGLVQIAYQQEVLKDLPVGYWRLAELAGTAAADLSLYANPGTYVGGVTLNQTGLLSGDTADKAVLLNGTTGTVSVADSASVSPTGSLTIEAFVNPASVTGIRTILRKGSDFYLRINAGAWEWGYTDAATAAHGPYSAGTVAAATVYHVVLTFTAAGNMVLTVNNSVVATVAMPVPTVQDTTALLYIGSNGGASDWFSGVIDEVALYPTNLSADRIAKHYAARVRANPAADLDSLPWCNVSPFVRQIGTSRGRQHELNRMETGTGAIRFNNTDRRFEPEYQGGYTGSTGLVVSGNEITDIVRAAAASLGTGASGQMIDALLNDSSFGIHRAATNLFRRGQCDAVSSSWGFAVVGTTASVDATVPAPFSPQSMKYVCDGTGANQGCVAQTSTGQAAATGTIGVGSIYFKGVAGQAYFAKMRWQNTDATVTDGVQLNFNATGSWQLIAPASVAVEAAKTGDMLQVMSRIAGTRAETNWAAHAMLEVGQAVVAPYVATSGGSTATHAAGRVQAPSSLVGQTQGWIAIRFRTGWSSAVEPRGGAGSDELFSYLDGAAGANGLRCFYREASNDWRLRVNSGGSGLGDVATAADTFVAGDLRTIVAKWTATTLAISLNGAPFVTANISPVAFADTGIFDIGTFWGSVGLEGEVLWFACGTGVLTNASVSNFHALGNVTSLDMGAFGGKDGAPKVTMVWNANDATFLADTAPYYPNVIPMRRTRLRMAWPPQMVPNGSFERSSSLVAPWVATVAGAATVAVDTGGDSLAATGMSNKLAMTSPAGAAVDAAFVQSDYIPVDASKPYSLSAYFTKSAAGTPYMALRVACFDDAKKSLGIGIPSPGFGGDGHFTFSGAVGTPTKIGGVISGTSYQSGQVGFVAGTKYIKVTIYGIYNPNSAYTGTVYIDDVALTPGVNMFADADYRIAGDYDANDAWVERYNGYAESWDMGWTQRKGIMDVSLVDGFEPLTVSNISVTMPQHLSGARESFTADAAGWPRSERVIATGQSLVQGSVFANNLTQPLTHMLDVADTEGGVVFVARDGKLTFQDRNDRISGGGNSLSKATFGDGGIAAAGELPYISITPNYGIDQVFNYVSVTRNGGNQQVAEDAASQQQYWKRELARSGTWHTTDGDALAVAGVLLARYKQPALRFDAIVVDPTHDPAIWPAILKRELSNRITVVRRPEAAAAGLIRAVHIEHVSDTITLGDDAHWQTELQLSPADTNSYWIMDTSLLDTGTRLAL